MMNKYIKKAIEVEAIKFTGDNSIEVAIFMEMAPVRTNIFMIDTLEGMMTVSKGDYVIKGIKGEFYPCKSDIFEATYKRLTK